MSWLCKIGLHRWYPPTPRGDGMARAVCERCGEPYVRAGDAIAYTDVNPPPAAPTPSLPVLVPGTRGPRLTIVQATVLGYQTQRVRTPWSLLGETLALVPTDEAPCQVCWHRRDEHSADAEDDFMCLLATCACRGWDGFLDA